MRVSDIMLSQGMMDNISKTKEKIETLSVAIANSSKVNKPSDAPETAAKLLRLGTQFGRNDSHSKNVNDGLSFLNETIFSMESVQSEITGILTKLTEANNATVTSNYSAYAKQIDLALESIMNAANSQSDGKYIFGGTDHSALPFGLSADQSSIESKTADNTGKQLVKLSSNIFQQINLTGGDVFGTKISGTGNLDSGAAVGDIYNVTEKIYNSSKEEYDFSITYTKTADNTYSLSYDVLDSSSNTIYSTPPAAVELKFDPLTGKFATLAGKKSPVLKINNSDHHIDLHLDLTKLTESASANSVSLSLNQKTDIFNTLIRIRDDLNNGVKPSAEDEEMVTNFNKQLLDKIAEAGNISNQLFETQELLTNQKSVLESLIAKEQDVDVAKAIMELQTHDYMLQMAYKVSSSILPKSLLDYI